MFKIPETIDGLSVEDLKGLIKEARAAGRALVEPDEVSEDDLKAASDIMEFLASAEGKVTELEEAKAAADKTLADARGAFEDPAEEGDEPEGDEPEAEVEVEVDTEAKEPVAASAAKKVAKVTPPKAPEVKKDIAVITASADVPGYTTGEGLDSLDSVAKALQARLARLPKTRQGGAAFSRYGVAQFSLKEARTDGLSQENVDYKTDQDLVSAAAKESRLSGNSLTAAGTWCSPSEVLYGFCSEESTDGILDLPSITATRGGIRYTKGPDFSAIYANENLGWNLTEAEVAADTEKTMIEVECPSFSEVRLNAVGLGVKAGILTDAAYPELVRRYIEAALIAHQHKVAAGIYADISAGSTARDGSDAQTAMDTLGVLEINAEYERQRKRMAFNTTLEVLAPVWLRTILRADLARRNGVDATNVTDQMLEAHFATRGLRVQWLYNTGQDLAVESTKVVIPDTVTLPMYPAGTWVKATTDVISLDAVYDSTNLAVNTFTALFVEEGLAVVNTCGDSVKVTIPTLASGETGAANIATGLFSNPTPPTP